MGRRHAGRAEISDAPGVLESVHRPLLPTWSALTRPCPFLCSHISGNKIGWEKTASRSEPQVRGDPGDQTKVVVRARRAPSVCGGLLGSEPHSPRCKHVASDTDIDGGGDQGPPPACSLPSAQGGPDGNVPRLLAASLAKRLEPSRALPLTGLREKAPGMYTVTTSMHSVPPRPLVILLLPVSAHL